MQTIDEVIVELDSIIHTCLANHSRQAYFAILYRQMTVAVQAGIKTNAFEDAVRMEKLDVLFAQRYIDAWKAFQIQQPTTQSWAHAFSTAAQTHTVMQHLLLGINTHINVDLAIAAATTAPGNNIFALQHDFNKINDAIEILSGTIQEKLSKIWWPMKWLTNISNGREKAVLNFSIQKAREVSWANAVALAFMEGHDTATRGHIQQMDMAVLQLGRKIENPGFVAQLILQPVSWFEYKDVQRVAALLS
ncbi:MAG TPA: DUF5995 family protein [Phnomibacter sp.]|nr:DUF5995 family protein [Phnomibacter sp.]